MTIKKILRPKTSSELKLKRFGSTYDGGYILASYLLDKTSAFYSYGIGDNAQFDDSLCQNNIPGYLYDHTISKNPSKCLKNKLKNEALSSQSILNHLKQNGHQNNNDLLLKMDVEGAEYEFLQNIAEETLNQFNQIVMEIHDVINDKPESINIFQKLEKNHTLVHIHSNNHGKIFDGLPNTLEVTYVRNDLIPNDCQPTNLTYPIKGLDNSNNPLKNDNKLNWWN